MDFGVLSTVPARDKWKNEARDFTPWLANNINELSNAIGIELEVESTEVNAGPYSADILAKDTGSGQYVVIENQLEKTDHDHLGKAITYAAVLDAAIIIWIATKFTEEHKKAIDWLNDHTSDEISFYGVQVELWQIDNSRAALRFNIISQPNQAVRQANITKTSDELTNTRKFQLDFWSRFKDALEKTNTISSKHTPRPQYWYDVALGKSDVHLSNTCNTDENTVGVRLYIKNKIVPTMYPYLESRKDEIEEAIGQKLLWNPNPDNRDRVISILHTTDFKEQQNVDEAIKWLVEYTIKFHQTFAKLVKQAP